MRFGRAHRCSEYLQPQRSLPSRLTPGQLLPRVRRPQAVRLENRERNERTMRSVNTLILGIFLAGAAPGLLGQAKPAPAAAPTAPHRAKAAGKSAAKKAAPAEAPTQAPGGDAAQASTDAENKFARRDPFESLLSRQQAGSGKNLPPGKAGLQVSTLRLDGIVRANLF